MTFSVTFIVGAIVRNAINNARISQCVHTVNYRPHPQSGIVPLLVWSDLWRRERRVEIIASGACMQILLPRRANLAWFALPRVRIYHNRAVSTTSCVLLLIS